MWDTLHSLRNASDVGFIAHAVTCLAIYGNAFVSPDFVSLPAHHSVRDVYHTIIIQNSVHSLRIMATLSYYGRCRRHCLTFTGAAHDRRTLRADPNHRGNRFLDKLGKTGSPMQLVNGIFLLATFFSVRIVYGGYMVSLFCSFKPAGAYKESAVQSWQFFLTMSAVRSQIHPVQYAGYLGGNLTLNFLNWLWYVLSS